MPRANPVTQEAVSAAASALVAKNQRPTLAAIRQEVGGSYNTLSPMLKAWREAHAKQEQTAIEMPDAVTAKIKGLAGELWQIASLEASAKVKAAEEAAEQQAQATESELEELLSVIKQLEDELNNVQKSLSNSDKAKDKAKQALETLKNDMTRERAETAAAREMLAQANSRNETLQKELIELARKSVKK